MDQYFFDLKIQVIGFDIFDLITLLQNNGFDSQAQEIEKQVESELNLMS